MFDCFQVVYVASGFFFSLVYPNIHFLRINICTCVLWVGKLVNIHAFILSYRISAEDSFCSQQVPLSRDMGSETQSEDNNVKFNL